MDIVLTDIQILALIMCAVLSYIAYRTRTPTISLIPAIGFFLLGFKIYEASEDLLILALFFMTAIVQFVLCFSHATKR